MASGQLILTRADVARLLDLDACIAAVERAFLLLGEGKAQPPVAVGVPAPGGVFHTKAARLELDRPYFAVKTNGNFPGNPERHGLPTVQGIITLYDGVTGRPLAVLDGIEITIQRTGAATAVAARRLARPDSTVATICGCGVQGRIQLAALRAVLPIRKVFAWDVDAARATAFAHAAGPDVVATAVSHLRTATRASDVIVTCTPARRWFLGPDDVAPGAFVAAVGADNEDKQEIAPELLAASTVVVDLLDQAAMMGDLHHALAGGVMSRGAVHAELGEIVAGVKSGRRSNEQIMVFDSTGTALQDVAAAAVVYERAVAQGAGVRADIIGGGDAAT